MHRYILRRTAALLALSLAALVCDRASASPVVYPEVVAVHPHDPYSGTQAMLLHDGDLYESTGPAGQSALRRLDLTTGEVLQQYDLPAEYFGRGLALVDQRLIQLTRQEHVAFIYDVASFEILGQFAYEEQGWGLTFDGTHLIMTDGWTGLIYRDPDTFEISKEVNVVNDIYIWPSLDDMEVVDGLVYGTGPMQTIVAIDPEIGEVLVTYDCSELVIGDSDPSGIAYDPVTQHFFVTGENWTGLHEVKLPSPFAEESPPNVAFVSPVDQAQYQAPAILDMELMADDGDGLGVARIEVFLNGELYVTRERSPLTPEPWVIPNANLEAGEYTFTARAYDAWGNMAESDPATIFVSEASDESGTDTGESEGSGSDDGSGGGATDLGADEEAGCACAASTRSSAPGASLAVLLGMLGLARARRRRLG